MSSTLVQPEPVETPVASGNGSLLRAEMLRLTSRRMVRLLVALAAVGFLAGVAIASTQYAKPSAEGLARAEVRIQEIVQQQEQYRAECLASVGRGPGGPSAPEQCGPVPTAQDIGSPDMFLDKGSFDMGQEGKDGVLGIAAATAALAFLLGASYVGAEWSSRSMVALLFWEPRRGRVMAAKLAVLTLGAALLGLAAQAAWLVAARVLAATRGTPEVPPGLWGDLAESSGRGVLFVVLAALAGFGVANLIRNTGAALGAGFVYFAVIENVVRAVRPEWQPWLLTENSVALLTPGGLQLFLNEGFVDGQGMYQSTGREVLLTNLHGGLVLTVVTALVVAAGVVLFARRDLS